MWESLRVLILLIYHLIMRVDKCCGHSSNVFKPVSCIERGWKIPFSLPLPQYPQNKLQCIQFAKIANFFQLSNDSAMYIINHVDHRCNHFISTSYVQVHLMHIIWSYTTHKHVVTNNYINYFITRSKIEFHTYKLPCTRDWEIFTLKIICGLNFCVKNILSLDGSAM